MLVNRRFVAVLAVLALSVPLAAKAQDVTSTEPAKELAQLLDQKKLDSIAAPDPDAPGTYIGALYFPGTQLLVVEAQYAAPAMLNDLLGRKDFRGVYVELSSASVVSSKVFVMDALANGLAFKPSGGAPADSIERATVVTAFDGNWKKAKISEADYAKAFTDADAAYTRVLQILIKQLKSSGT